VGGESKDTDASKKSKPLTVAALLTPHVRRFTGRFEALASAFQHGLHTRTSITQVEVFTETCCGLEGSTRQRRAFRRNFATIY
jgi:hypothetical protein